MISLIATAKRTFVCFSSAFGRPRSANTLPELATTRGLSFGFAIPHLKVHPGLLKSPAYLFNSPFCRSYASGRLLLESVEHVNHTFKSARVNRTIGVSTMIFDNLEYARTFSLPRLRVRMLADELGNTERGADLVLDCTWEREQVFLTRPDPE